jgi:LemA protein
VDEKWSNVQSAYQRRADLIPALVKQVKAGSKNEREILTQVTQARAGIVNAKTPDDLELMGRKINTAINLAYEAYPELTSTKLFVDFGRAVEGTENRINYARDEYNGSVKTYNTHIRSFFASMFLNREEFPKKEGFKAKKGSEDTPDFELE